MQRPLFQTCFGNDNKLTTRYFRHHRVGHQKWAGLDPSSDRLFHLVVFGWHPLCQEDEDKELCDDVRPSPDQVRKTSRSSLLHPCFLRRGWSELLRDVVNQLSGPILFLNTVSVLLFCILQLNHTLSCVSSTATVRLIVMFRKCYKKICSKFLVLMKNNPRRFSGRPLFSLLWGLL